MNKYALLFFALIPLRLFGQPAPFDFDVLFDSIDIYNSQGNYERGFQLYEHLHRHLSANPNDDDLFNLLINEGYTFTMLGYQDKAESLFREALALAGKMRDKFYLANAHYALGYLAQERIFSKSSTPPAPDIRAGFSNAIALFKELKDTTFLIDAYDAQGYLSFMEDRLDDAIYYGEKATCLLCKIAEKESLPNVFSNLAEYHIAKGDYKMAERYVRRAFEWLSDNPRKADDEIRYNVWRNQALVMLHFGNEDEGFALVDSVLTYSRKVKNIYLLKETSNLLVNDALKNGNYQRAFTLQTERMNTLDSLHTTELAINHERNQTLLNIGLREKEYLVLEEKLATQRITVYAAFGFSILLLALLLSLYFLNRQGKQFNKKLQAEVERQTHELRSSNEALERFAYVASHDLRTPLRNIISFIGLIQRRLKPASDDADIHTFIGYTKEYANHMNLLLNDILEYSKLGHHTNIPALTSVDLNEVIYSTFTLAMERIRACNGIFEAGLLPSVKGEKTLLLRLFQNLVENGFTYNEAETPLVSISQFELRAEEVVICVRDNGIGIDPQFHDKVFNMFTRLHNLEQYPGTGLGLSICKRIVQDLGGRIWLRSSPGNGTSIFLTLPLAADYAPDHSGTPEENGRLSLAG